MTMTRLKRLLTFWFLCSQVLFVSVAGAGLATYDNLHVATAHQLALDHHHHDDFSSHFDHEGGADTHVHAMDSFQSVALIQEKSSDVKRCSAQQQPALRMTWPPDIFLDGLLRPPQTLL